MNMKGIATAIGNAASKVGFSLKRRSPEICLVTGIVGMVGTVILACVATRKVDNVIEEHQKQIVDVERLAVHEDDPKKAEREGKMKVYIHTSWEFVKLYGPAAALGATSIFSLIASHNTLKKQTLVLGATYSALDRSFREYRKRVSALLGEEKEKDIFSGALGEPEKKEGGEIVESETPVIVSNGILSPYARPFDELCVGVWVRDAETNFLTLQAIQEDFNKRLKARGHVYLNEVYEELGVPLSQAGHHVGWIFDERNPTGDNFIDFGIYKNKMAKKFLEGDEPSIWLDFNVDGVIDADPRIYKYRI